MFSGICRIKIKLYNTVNIKDKMDKMDWVCNRSGNKLAVYTVGICYNQKLNNTYTNQAVLSCASSHLHEHFYELSRKNNKTTTKKKQ